MSADTHTGANAADGSASPNGQAIFDAVTLTLAGLKEQGQMNELAVRALRADNERLRDTLQKIATDNYTGEDVWDCPGDVAPDAWLARKALATVPPSVERADGTPIGEAAPSQPWQPIDARHKTGVWIVAIHKDRPMIQALVRWVDPGVSPFCWEVSTSGRLSGRLPEETFSHAYFRGAPPSDVETITEAAILHRAQPWSVPRPGRHGDVVRRLAEAHPNDGPFVEEQGFMTSHGRFVGRVEAGRIALAAGQIPALRWAPNLFSEDLW